MKNNKNVFILVIMLVASCSFNALRALSDDAVVDSIKAYSDLTQSDADKLKLLWLGFLSEPAVAAASAYGIYRAGKAAQGFAPTQSKLNTVFQSQIYSSFLNRPSETVQNLIKSKWTWAGIGSVGAGVAAYKLLYPRVQAGLLDKVQRYLELCKTLAVAQYHADINSFNRALQEEGNTTWDISSFTAKNYGFNNLIDQAKVALLLIDQLLASGGNFDMDILKTKTRPQVLTIKNNLERNQQFIQSGLRAEQQIRAQQRADYGKDLDIQNREAGIAGQRVKNVTNQWKLLKDIGETAGSIIGAFFPKEMKPVIKEYGPSAVLGLAAYKGYNWWMNPGQQSVPVSTSPAPE